jgi:SAM-dependent methyltransferase
MTDSVIGEGNRQPAVKPTTVVDPEVACVVCGSARRRVLRADNEFRIVQCLDCRLGMTLPQSYIVQSDYDASPQFAARYEAQNGQFRQYARRFLRQIRSVAPTGRLLDVGCSIGLLVEEARLLGFDADGVDLDSNAVRYAGEKGRSVHQAAVGDWGHDDYDVVCLSHTLEHLSIPAAFLGDCASKLKAGGCLAVAVPCYCGLHPRLFGRRWYGWIPSQHYCHYSPEALKLLFGQVGLEPLKIWQESMDHRPVPGDWRGWKDAARGLTGYLAAAAGGAIGQGDQLVGIARKAPTRYA